MAKPWLKLWCEARTDAKLDCLDDQSFRIWFKLLCLAGQQEVEGTIDLPTNVVAAEVASGSVEKLKQAGNALVTSGCVTTFHFDPENRVKIVFDAWQKRQANYQSWSKERTKERVRKHREAKGLTHVMGRPRKVVTSGNKPVTSGNKPVTSCNKSRLQITEEREEDFSLSTDKNPPPISPHPEKVVTSGNKSGDDDAPPKLPEWLPIPEWEAFVAMRREIGKPLTPLSVKQRIAILRDLRVKGYDPAHVIKQSTDRKWESFYEPKGDLPGTKPTPKPPEIKYHVAPPDSPFRKHAEELRRRKAEVIAGLKLGPGFPGSGTGDAGSVPAG